MNTINSFPEDIENVAKFILANLSRIDESANGINYSASDYGYSAYIYLNNNRLKSNKIRISDHSVGGNRFFYEICLNTIKQAESFFTRCEIVMKPQLFDEVEFTTTLNGKPYTGKKKVRKSINH